MNSDYMVAQVIPSDHNIFYGVLCLWFESYFILLQYLPIKKNEPKKKKNYDYSGAGTIL